MKAKLIARVTHVLLSVTYLLAVGLDEGPWYQRAEWLFAECHRYQIHWIYLPCVDKMIICSNTKEEKCITILKYYIFHESCSLSFPYFQIHLSKLIYSIQYTTHIIFHKKSETDYSKLPYLITQLVLQSVQYKKFSNNEIAKGCESSRCSRRIWNVISEYWE